MLTKTITVSELNQMKSIIIPSISTPSPSGVFLFILHTAITVGAVFSSNARPWTGSAAVYPLEGQLLRYSYISLIDSFSFPRVALTLTNDEDGLKDPHAHIYAVYICLVKTEGQLIYRQRGNVICFAAAVAVADCTTAGRTLSVRAVLQSISRLSKLTLKNDCFTIVLRWFTID